MITETIDFRLAYKQIKTHVIKRSEGYMKTDRPILGLARCFPNSVPNLLELELTRRELIKIRVKTFPACLKKLREKCLYDVSEKPCKILSG